MRYFLPALAVLAGCAVERPDFQLKVDRYADLKHVTPPPRPEFAPAETDDEAEIQFRAAFVFYNKERWSYAATAFEEALDYNADRHDIRMFLIYSLLLAKRDEEAAHHANELVDTPYEMRARPLLARALLRMGRAEEAREACVPAASENFDAAGWLARYDGLTSSR
jgi:tetratricopeptide (TPR) repeat protein